MSEFFLQRPKFAFVLSILITLAGLLALQGLPVNMYPDLAPPQVQVRTIYPGASADAVAEAVVRPIEQRLNGVEGMIYIESSTSSDGSATITVTFATGTDADMAQVNVQNRVKLAESQLPEEVRREGVVVRKQAGNMLMGINLVSDRPELDGLFLSNYANTSLLENLARVPGVAEAQVLGTSEYAMRIWLDPERMNRLGLTVADVNAAIREQNQIVAAGTLGQEPAAPDQIFTFNVRSEGRLSEAGEFGRTVVRTGAEGRVVRLRDVARIELGARSYAATAQLNGRDTAFLVIYQLPDANALDVAERVRSEMTRLAGAFPEGLNYAILFDSTRFIDESIREVVKTLFEAVVLVVLVVFLFLQSLRATLIPAIAIPVSLIGTFAFMAAMGYSVNLITLFGLVLAIGIVVDDAIVVIENVDRLMHEKGLEVREAVSRAMREITAPIVSTTLVLLAVFVPVAFLPGITGELFRQFAVTICFAVVISMINALTLSPALSSVLLRGGATPMRWLRPVEAFIQRLTLGYRWLIERMLKRPFAVAGMFLVLTGALVYLAATTPTGFVPEEDQGFLFVDVQLPDAASGNRTADIMQQVTDDVLQDPAVSDFIGVSGFSLINGSGSNMGFGVVVLKDWSERETAELQPAAVLDRLNARLWAIAGARIMAFNVPAIPGLGVTAGFDLRLLDSAGVSPQELATVADNLVLQANQREELIRVRHNLRANVPMYDLEVDRDKAKTLGVDFGDVFVTLQAQLGGMYVNDFSQFGRTYRVMLGAESQYRSRPEDLRHFQVRNEAGEMVPIAGIASLEPAQGPTQLEGFNLYRSVTINGEPAAGASTIESVAAMEELMADLPDNYSFAWAGQTLQELEAGNLIVVLFALAIVTVYLFLVALYESWTLPVAVMLSVPLAFLGSFIAFRFTGQPVDIYAQIGLVLLVAMAAKTAILIVEFAAQLHREGRSIVAAAAEAAVQRFRAVLMTGLSFMLGVTPLVLATGAGAASRISLGVTVLWGMAAAMILVTLMTPAFYVMIQSLRERFSGAAATPAPGPDHSAPAESTP
ncbi:MAG: multidrug efflux RND transporter permease subunit [Wenzhouxiangellaceae bacterium]|nr:multidrug efflux RND transporter permease subunit [Wenzhouxiangellaceae bacterium]MBS3746287.1 multidrug efflux RND transporter permease subunit [Wenzhouxiangellaceae bacterium]MBS3823736.1 multidrug efflux RND transporter permease subunit [Wenzhouxiangellaceae bacterium]